MSLRLIGWELMAYNLKLDSDNSTSGGRAALMRWKKTRVSATWWCRASLASGQLHTRSRWYAIDYVYGFQALLADFLIIMNVVACQGLEWWWRLRERNPRATQPGTKRHKTLLPNKTIPYPRWSGIRCRTRRKEEAHRSVFFIFGCVEVFLIKWLSFA